MGGTEAKILSEKLLGRVKDNRILLFLIQFLRNYSPDSGKILEEGTVVSLNEFKISKVVCPRLERALSPSLSVSRS
jgi:hypothetical protein